MTQMEELVQQCDMEVMKMAMLKHEETFRQQVHDLHRLYRVQKQLMVGDQTRRPSVPPCRQVQRRRQHPRRPELSLQLPVDDDEYTAVSAGTSRLVTPPSTESEDELELTLAVGGGGVNSGCRRQRRRRESAMDCSGRRSPQTPSSSTDSDDALRTVPHHQRATACDLRGGVMVSKQPQWLVRCLSLRMA